MSAAALSGRVAVVTGAASGLGRVIARSLAAAGAHVAAVDRDRAGAEETADSVREKGGSASAHEVDVTDRAAVGAVVDAVATEQGRIDVLVTSAGIIRDAPLLDAAESDLDAVFAVNAKGVLFACQAAGPHLRRAGGGSIVNIASTAIDFGAPGNGLYAVSKVAVAQISRTLAVELGPDGIRVNTVAPGFVVTTMTERNFRDADGGIDTARRDHTLERHRGSNPLHALCEPEDIADTVLHLASDASRVVTGQVLRVNAGVSMPL